jgi:hypothetical protein
MKTSPPSRLSTAGLYSTKLIPLALLLACTLAHGLLIPWLGFYWDDWPTVWFLNRFGPTIFNAAYGVDRPALGWLFTVTTTIVGQSALAWQIFALLMRWTACLSLWAMLRAVWPARKIETAWVAFLFAIYPGFMQQPIALTYSADWIAIALFFISFWLMIKATRLQAAPNDERSLSKLWPFILMILSWLLAAYVMFADEYYFGLELLRPVFLWLVLSEVTAEKPGAHTRRQRLGQVMLRWLPYLAIMMLFLFWRLVIFVSPRGQVQVFNQLTSQPVATLLALARKVFIDLYQSGLSAWAQTLNINTIIHGINSPRILAAYISLIVLASGLAIYYFRKIQPSTYNTTGTGAQKTWAIQVMLIGVFALFVGGWPFWVTELPIELYFPWDRFNLAMMLGACLALAGLIVLLARTPLSKAISFGVICGLAIGFHFYNANLFRQDWNRQRDFFWQLTWRVPALQPGTLILTNDPPFKYYSDNSLTAPLNLIFAPENHTKQLPYMLYNIESRLGLGLVKLKADLPIQQVYRVASFNGNTSNTLVLFYDPPRCLKVIDPVTDLLLPHKPAYIDDATLLSNLGRIEVDNPNPAQPPRQFFGTEPEPNWCYYFQKADLARQQKNWVEVARLGDLALALKVQPDRENNAEFLPYIQGYAQVGEWDKAVQLTKQVLEAEPKIADMLCPIWYDLLQANRMESSGKSEGENAFEQVNEVLNCTY